MESRPLLDVTDVDATNKVNIEEMSTGSDEKYDRLRLHTVALLPGCIWRGLNLTFQFIQILAMSILLKSQLQRCDAAVLETSAVSGETTTTTTSSSSINPWPTDTIYTYSSQNECIVTATGAPANDCLLSVTLTNPDPGFVTNYCGRKNWTTYETRTLTVDCEGCADLSVTVRRGGCPMGGSHPATHTPEPTPGYLYRWICAASEASLPTLSACTTPP
ncbi:hypothetical protein F5Y08DRAFT_301317 [Xylaria arbuscula]|nr:hypothetical protein F5Y08DRAFT_301317 [Xylaria arbuscula]